MSLRRWRNESEGGRRELMLKTSASTSNLWPTTGPSLLLLLLFWLTNERLWDLDTKPGTEACSIWLRSRWSAARSADFSSISDNLKTRWAD